MIVYMFPGQGSQHPGMGKELFESYPEYVEKADEVLGHSLAELCLQESDPRLNRTEFTQPALFAVNVLSYLRRIEDSGRFPDWVVGHSLGEYNALFAAGVFDFETGLRLVQRRGQLMSQASGGGMAAVIGLPADEVLSRLRAAGLDGIDIANHNAPRQIVIAGPSDDIDRAAELFQSPTRCVRLRVSGAFHSRQMRAPRDAFGDFVRTQRLRAPRLPVIANATAQPYSDERLAETLVEQIASPVRWTEILDYLKHRGAQEFVEIGPGTVLTNLLREHAAA
ncbi:malonyl CoA-acyl carrier protein transacylase [Lysobacter sp. yr284]|uniref:ACP S-malonyltransferase n=1 Tax=Lysobacter sp. yr284 TaxID=1761791 RepID=UPI000899C954|nr:ACP S-malonyltransferase [Lysobacter sp. yr284]SDY35973.1 malonyl CoA-acyl carrier protein transacylase [Lysobacter sp. yr284]